MGCKQESFPVTFQRPSEKRLQMVSGNARFGRALKEIVTREKNFNGNYVIFTFAIGCS